MAVKNKLVITICIVAVAFPLMITAQNNYENFIESEPPAFLSYNSPLRQPDSLRSRPYYDFLSTLYRRDATKSELFRPYQRTRRNVPTIPENIAVGGSSIAVDKPEVPVEYRQKRAIIFRPLFVYRQQQVRKQELAAKRRRRY